MDAADFPDDLMQTQHAWNATYAVPHRSETTAVRRRLLRLSIRLWWHPYWNTARSAPAARTRVAADGPHPALSPGRMRPRPGAARRQDPHCDNGCAYCCATR
jgi:hypothetical protein